MSRVKIEKVRVKHVWICTLVGWLVVGPSCFSQDVVLSVFLPALFAALLCGVRDVVLSVYFTGIVCNIIVWCAREK